MTVGLITPQSGPYKAIGDDMRQGFTLYLTQHHNQLGGHPVRVVTADEGDGGAATRAAATKLIKKDGAVALAGTAAAPAAATVANVANTAGVPFVGFGGRPSTITDVSHVWHTSFMSTDFGQAIGRHLATTVKGPVYVIGPDYQGGKDQIGGFTQAFTAAGGTIANPGGTPAYTPWPTTANFAPWLQQAIDSKATAVYAFYAGAPATGFVKQYRQFLGDLPLYGAGFLTEGSALAAESSAATGVRTVMPYAPGLDNPTNKAFTAALAAQHSAPNLYHVTSFDAAAVLDKAIGAAGSQPTGENINTAIAHVGDITSPRGHFHFGAANHTPVQMWYLRQVTTTGGAPTNQVITDLGTLGH